MQRIILTQGEVKYPTCACFHHFERRHAQPRSKWHRQRTLWIDNRTCIFYSNCFFTDLHIRISIVLLNVCYMCTRKFPTLRFYCSFRITSSLKAYRRTWSLGLAYKHYCDLQNDLKQGHSMHFSSVRRGIYFLHCRTVSGISQRQVFWKANIAWKQ